MGKIYLLTKKNEYLHSTTTNKKNQLVKDGWKLIATINGWNMSISFDYRLK